jgi:hypothetical protein
MLGVEAMRVASKGTGEMVELAEAILEHCEGDRWYEKAWLAASVSGATCL